MSQIIPRSALILRPKQPFQDWLDHLPKAQAGDLSASSFRTEPHLYLIPDFDDREEVLEWLEDNYTYFFEDILRSWWTQESEFPARTFENFQEWFDLEIIPLVEDSVEEEE